MSDPDSLSPSDVAVNELREAARTAEKVRPERVTGLVLRLSMNGASDAKFKLPAVAWEPVYQVVQRLAAGEDVRVTAAPARLSALDVARALGLPRGQVARWMTQGRLASQPTPAGLVMSPAHLAQQQAAFAAARASSLDELAVEAQALGLGY